MRTIWQKALAAALCGALLASCLSGCGGGAAKTEITVCNWGDYMDEDTIADFEAETGIHVNLVSFTDNESLYATLKSGSAAYDVICPSDYMVSRMIAEDMLAPIHKENLPNLAYLDEDFLSGLDYDPEGVYSVPYLWGVVGLIYNTTMVEEAPTSWDILWDESLAGQILMFDNSRDAIGIALKLLGYSYNTTDPGEIQAAVDKLIEQKPLVQAYVMDQIFDKLEAGEAAVGPYYAGDAVVMMAENPDLACVYPEEGSNYFIDAWCIPKNAPDQESAEAFINYMCRPEVMAANAAYDTYAPPSTAARALMEELGESELVFPPETVRQRCEIYQNLPQDALDLDDSEWLRLKAS
jgi:spermidine/putrescine transport system substrate-binding protein